jgi:hypothetical protein
MSKTVRSEAKGARRNTRVPHDAESRGEAPLRYENDVNTVVRLYAEFSDTLTSETDGAAVAGATEEYIASRGVEKSATR